MVNQFMNRYHSILPRRPSNIYRIEHVQCTKVRFKMHNPDRWPMEVGPAGTRDVTRLNLIDQLDGMRQDMIQFDNRIRLHLAKMREMLTKCESKPAVPTKPVQPSKQTASKKVNVEIKSIEKMGKAIESALMSNKPESNKPKKNEVLEIKRALERAFAEGRPKQMEKNAENGKLTEDSDQLSQMKQPAVLKHVVKAENMSTKTRVLHATTELTGGDDYIVQPMEVEEPTKQPEKGQVKLSESQPMMMFHEMEHPKSPSTERTLLKRRAEPCEKHHQLIPSKRMKSPQALAEGAAQPKHKNGQYINPMSVHKLNRIPKMRITTPQATSKNFPSAGQQLNQNGPSISPLTIEQSLNHTDPSMSPLTERSTKQNGISLSPSTEQSNENGSSAPLVTESLSKQNSTDNSSDTENDEDYVNVSNPALDLEIKRELQDAIENPLLANFNGNFPFIFCLIFFFFCFCYIYYHFVLSKMY